MSRSRSLSILGLAPVLAAAIAIAGCGGGGGGGAYGGGGTAAQSPAPTTTPGHSATVGVAKTNLGTTLVDTQGRTLYLFKKDAGTKSACFGACASAWPPVLANGKPTAGSGVKPSLIGTAQRADGARQVTYNGRPLYLFKGDQKAGQTSGQGVNAFGAAWYALTPAGSQISSALPTSSGGGGY